MRKLALIPLASLLVVAPASGAPLDRPAASADLIAGVVDPLHVEEAERQLRIANRRAEPPPEPPAPEPVAVPPHLQAIAECESGGDPTAIGGGGLYRGKYQFSVETWQAVGGTGDPAAAPEAEQDLRAQILYDRSGPGQWPVCGS